MSEFNNTECMSLYIPYVYAYKHIHKNIESIEHDMTKAIELGYELGKVSHIDFVLKWDKDFRYFYQAYVHFEYWNDTEIARKWQQELNANPEIPQILYYWTGYNVNTLRKHHWKVMKNLSKKHVSGNRKLSLNIEENKKQEVSVETPQKQMTNKDFSDLVNAPIKKQEKSICDSESLESCAKKIDFSDNFEEGEQIQTHSDYVERIENRLKFLASTANRLNDEKMELLKEIEILKCEIKMKDSTICYLHLQLNKLERFK
jgi:hypothetical protein